MTSYPTLSKFLTLTLTALVCTRPAALRAAVENAYAPVMMAQFEPGSKIDLTGQWIYKPGYDLPADQKPQFDNTTTPTGASREPSTFIESTTENPQGYVPVPVPQILSRIQWWLDDSEDFKKHENDRLKKLGFDADKAEDGWYRLTVNLHQLPPGRRLYLQFDGVAMRCQVFWNGVSLGTHHGMFSRHEYEVTPYVRPGANTLAVFVSMEKIRENTLSMGEAVTVNLTASKVKTMSKGMFGPMSPGRENREYDFHGIWQPVRLVTRGHIGIKDVWFQPRLDGATVEVDVPSIPAMSQTGYKLQAQWVDEVTSTVFAEVRQVTDSTTTLQLQNVQPKLWTPAEPNLYRLDVTLLSPGGEVLDKWSDKVGFRTFEARGNQLYLNGKPYWLRGANHLPYGKNPTDPALARKLIQQMHDNNQRITRTHCTPWNEAWLDAADEIGLGISIEGPRPWAFAGKIGPTPPDLMEHWLMENDDIVRRCRNHPSVFIWCIGNEMLIRDHDNPEKWAQLSSLVKQTRALDPTRPIVCASSYEREAKLYDKLLKPNAFDDGDIDAIHSYKGWYTESPFVSEPLRKPSKKEEPRARPLIGQEMSTGYPDLDTGLPVLRYTADLMTPQAWVGTLSYPGNDPKWFLEHHAIVTKRWAEQLRYTRGNHTAGMMMFANECWFNHSYDPNQCEPYPVVNAMRQAWAPIGIALETNRRRFFSGETVVTNVYITNDNEQFRDLASGELRLSISTKVSEETIAPVAKVPPLKYYETLRVPVQIVFPEAKERQDYSLDLDYYVDGKPITSSWGEIEVFPRIDSNFLMENYGKVVAVFPGATEGPAAPIEALTTGSEMRLREEIAETGVTAIVFTSGTSIMKYFPDDILTSTKSLGEFADWSPAADTPLARDLQPMDLKWWAREGDPRMLICRQAHRLKPGGRAREIIRFVPSHGYIRPERVPEQIQTVLFEIPLGKGRVWVCDLDVMECAETDPAAQLFLRNLWAAAADPHSMDKLKVLPSHEELLKDVLKTHKPTVGVYTKN